MDLTELEQKFLAPWAEAARDTAPVFVSPGGAVPVDEAAPSLAAWARRHKNGECWDAVRFGRAGPRAAAGVSLPVGLAVYPAGLGVFPPPAPEEECCSPAWRAVMRALAAAQEELGGLVAVAAAGLGVGLAHLCRRSHGAQPIDVVFVGAPPPRAFGRVLDVTLACLARVGGVGRGGGYHVSADAVLVEMGDDDDGLTIMVSREVAADFEAVFAGKTAAEQVLYTPADRQLGLSRSAALAYAAGCSIVAPAAGGARPAGRARMGPNGLARAGFVAVTLARAAGGEEDTGVAGEEGAGVAGEEGAGDAGEEGTGVDAGTDADSGRFTRMLVSRKGAVPGTIALISYDPSAVGDEKTVANSNDAAGRYSMVMSMNLFALAYLFTEDRLRALAAAAFAAATSVIEDEAAFGADLAAFDAVVDAQALDVQNHFAALAAAAREEFAAAPLRPGGTPPPDALLSALGDSFPPPLGGLKFSD